MSDAKKSKNPASVYRLGIGIVALAAVIALFAVIMPQLSARGDAKAEASTAAQQGAELEARVAMLRQKSADAEESLARLQNLTSAFPTEFAQAQFYNLLRKSAESAGVTIKSVTSTQPGDPATFDGTTGAAPTATPVPAPAPAAAPAAGADAAAPAAVPAAGTSAEAYPLAQVGLTISVEGDGLSIERFLNGLSSLTRPVIVDSVTLAADGTTGISGRTYLSRPLVVPSFKK